MTYCITLIFIFLVFWRPQEWLVPELFGWPVLQIITAISLVGLFIGIHERTERFPKTPAIMLAIGIWFASIMSHVAHGYFQGVLNTYQDTFKISLLLILLLVVISKISRARGVILVFVLAGVLMSTHALLQQATGFGFAGSEPVWVYDYDLKMMKSRSQFFGIFGDPNDLGQFLVCTIPLVFAYPRKLSPVNFMISCGVAWFIFMGLMSTGSRGAQVGLLVVVSSIIIMKFPSRWVPYLAVVGLVSGLVACAVSGSSLLDASARERLDYWGLGNQTFKANPIFGIGYGMFWMVAGDRAAHNAFVLCYTELGIFGYWFWFSLLQLGIIGCWRTRLAFSRPRTGEQKYMKRLSELSIASMVGFSVGAYFLSRAYTFPYFFLFGLLCAIPMIAERMLPEEHPPLTNYRTDVLGSGTIATLLSIVYVYISILVLNRGR
jgi:putative inorganic carbon (hco3(-)) transporter